MFIKLKTDPWNSEIHLTCNFNQPYDWNANLMIHKTRVGTSGTRGWHMDTYKLQKKKRQKLNSRAQKIGSSSIKASSTKYFDKPQTHQGITNPNNHWCLYTEVCRLKCPLDLRNTMLKNKASFSLPIFLEA